MTCPAEPLEEFRRFVGVWDLVSWEILCSDGRREEAFGGNSLGRVIYDSSGYMSAQIMRLDRPPFRSGTRLEGTLEEFKSAFEGYVAFFGTYVVDGAEKTVTHFVEGHLSPNQVGSRRVRAYEFKKDTLIMKPSPRRFNGVEAQPVLVWRRIG